MRTLRLAALLLVLYAVAVLANALFYLSWSGDASDMPAALARVAGFILLGVGVWQRRRWAWCAAMVLGSLLALAGLAGVVVGHRAGMFDGRPYPAVDYAFIGSSLLALVGAVVALALPRSRAALRRPA